MNSHPPHISTAHGNHGRLKVPNHVPCGHGKSIGVQMKYPPLGPWDGASGGCRLCRYHDPALADQRGGPRLRSLLAFARPRQLAHHKSEQPCMHACMHSAHDARALPVRTVCLARSTCAIRLLRVLIYHNRRAADVHATSRTHAQ